MEDSRVGHQELLVARSNKGGGEVCRWMRHVSKVQELKQSTSGKTDVQCDPRRAIELHLGRLYHQAAISPGIQCYPGSI